ncbi:MAG TPA: DUF4118 domain-containing protein [Stellaceae bacterium]|nr:DUF4118 domain-containing protein [Stellaceae bacterium]
MGASTEQTAKLMLYSSSGLRIRLAGAGVFTLLGALGALFLQTLGVNAEFQGFVPCVVLSCLMFGFLAGAVTAAGSTVVLWYYFVPPPGFALPTFPDVAHLVVFLAVAIFVCSVVAGQRRMNAELEKENFELGYRNFLLRELRARLRAPRA